MYPSSRVKLKVAILCLAAQRLSGVFEETRERCRDVLAAGSGSEAFLAGASALNNDSVPLQLCLSSSRRGSNLRVIGDPGSQCPDLEDRYECSCEALNRCVTSSGSSELFPLVNSTLRLLIPDLPEERSGYIHGFLWIAVSPDHPGLAFYVEAAPLNKAISWDKVTEWLAEMLPNMDEACAVLGSLREHAVPASLGLEGNTSSDVRAKIYFRLAKAGPLGQLGVDMFASEQVFDFLTIAMGSFGVDRDGLVLSVGFSVATGQLADIKVDLCGHCLTYANTDWCGVVHRLTKRFELPSIPVEEALNQYGCGVAFIGFGLDRIGKPRLNLYLNAAERRDAPSREEIEAAIADGVSYLCRLQQKDGRWTDFNLPVGASDQWITAYTGFALARAGKEGAREEATFAAELAANWLCSKRSYNSGWGYNGSTGPDSDSTAMAIGLLRELNLPIRQEDQEFLRDHWRSEGGLATYAGPRAWGSAHWDVTPVGYLGLSSAHQFELRTSFLDALNANRMPNGMWRTYWWRNPYYSTFLTLEVLAELGFNEPDFLLENSTRQFEVDNPFDLACAIGIHHLRSVPTERTNAALRGLLSWQQADGRWPGHPNLRVTDDGCFAPWDEPAGEYYTDDAATLTTATAIRVLTLLLTPENSHSLSAGL